jgi:paired amphipathic helix protein Sin3a
VRTYRLFFVSEKEDFLWKFRSKEEMEEAAANLMKRNVLRKQWLEKSRTIPVVVPKPVTDKTPIPLASTSSNIAEPPAVTEVESEAVEGKNESIPPPPQPPVDETTTV